MASIFNCWNCEKSLLGDHPQEEEYFFWCNKKCHDAYNRKVKKAGRVLAEWSDFMCNEGPCPKEMMDEARERHLLGENNWVRTRPYIEKSEEPTKTAKADKSKKKGGRTCGKCGKPGHNARTCGKQKEAKPAKPRKRITSKRKTSSKKAPIKKKRTRKKGTKRRQYTCRNCMRVGHNYRTCPRRAPDVGGRNEEHLKNLTDSIRRGMDREVQKRPAKQYKCGKCGQLGHNARTCNSV